MAKYQSFWKSKNKLFENVPFKIERKSLHTLSENNQISEIEQIISKLKSDKFGNEEKRKEFAGMVVSLAHSRDKEARKVEIYVNKEKRVI